MGSPITLASGTHSNRVVFGDFDGDGRKDLAVSNQSSGHISVYRGNGDGTYRAEVQVTASGGHFLQAGDFNGDGKLDFAYATDNGSGTPGTISVLLNQSR